MPDIEDRRNAASGRGQRILPREVTGLPHFNRYIGIDYSGAVTPESSCKGLRVYVAGGLRWTQF
jgi:hypothetical protein